MATKYAQAAMNWSANTWALTPGGADNLPPPGDGDIGDLNGFVVTMDIVRVPAAGTLLALTSVGTAGQLLVPMATLAADCAIFATTIQAGTADTILTTGAAPTRTLTITCTNLYGGSATYKSGVNHTSSAKLVVSGAVSGGTGTFSYGIRAASGAITINGNVTGGSGADADGIYNYYTGVINGDVTGGTGVAAHGVHNRRDAITLNGNLINSATSVAWAGRPPIWNIVDNANFAHWYVGAGPLAAPNTKFGPQPAAAQMLSGVVCGDVTGTLAMARLVGKGGGLVG